MWVTLVFYFSFHCLKRPVRKVGSQTSFVFHLNSRFLKESKKPWCEHLPLPLGAEGGGVLGCPQPELGYKSRPNRNQKPCISKVVIKPLLNIRNVSEALLV